MFCKKILLDTEPNDNSEVVNLFSSSVLILVLATVSVMLRGLTKQLIKKTLCVL